MPVSPAQKTAIQDVISALLNVTQGGRYKRRLTEMFLALPDKKDYPEYFQVIPQPRCLDDIQSKLEKDQYTDCLTVYEDLSLVFLNALYYNEGDSQIAADADKLRGVTVSEWKSRQVLPAPPDILPPTCPQVVHKPPTPPPRAPSPKPKPVPPPAPAPAARPPAPLLPKPSTSAFAAAAPATTPQAFRPITMRPRSTSPGMDINVDVDVEVEAEAEAEAERGTPEPEAEAEGGAEEEARDEETQAIVAQLERGLPRWKGLEDVGWNEGIPEERFLEIVQALKSHKDVVTANRLAAALESMPEETNITELPYTQPLSLKLIEGKARANSYASSKAFDMDVTLLFLKGRRYYDPGSEAYGRVLLLQRLYQAITSAQPPPGPPYVSSTNFASARAGPGTARPMYSHAGESEGVGVPGVTTFRVSNKDRSFVDELHYKGWRLHLGDWVHVANPDEPGRPIVGQVFRCFVSDEPATKGKPGLTVCWYYRPEQTIHPAARLFWENEVFKTSHFADHTLEDVIERIACQFTARHIRGRPRPPFWSCGWPLYVCDSRYNDRERCFVKIKNWNSCVPEEVRKNHAWMPIYPFERMVYPRRFGSPFLKKGVKGPGGIGDSVERAEGEKIEGGGTGRKRARKGGAGASSATDLYGPSKGHYVGAIAQPPASAAAHAHYPMQQGLQQPPRPGSALAIREDRSLLQAAGGAGASGHVSTERLPAETVRHFDRDGQTNEVLWFAAPPRNVAHTPAPQYSLTYLHHLAMKRKRAAGEGGANAGDEAAAAAAKRAREQITPTTTDTINRLLQEHSLA